MRRAVYTPDLGPLQFLIGTIVGPVEVELLGYEERDGVRYARIVQATPPNSILGVLAKQRGNPHPPPIEKLVPASRVLEIGADA
jgi:hypothetical protein